MHRSTRVLYESNQDFAARMARFAAPNRVLDKYMHRTLRNESQATFERHLHEAMGYRSHTVGTDGF